VSLAPHTPRAPSSRAAPQRRGHKWQAGEKSSVNDVGIKTCSKTTIQQLKRKGPGRVDGSVPKAP
jgi:hypothetical protein